MRFKYPEYSAVINEGFYSPSSANHKHMTSDCTHRHQLQNCLLKLSLVHRFQLFPFFRLSHWHPQARPDESIRDELERKVPRESSGGCGGRRLLRSRFRSRLRLRRGDVSIRRSSPGIRLLLRNRLLRRRQLNDPWYLGRRDGPCDGLPRSRRRDKDGQQWDDIDVRWYLSCRSGSARR